VYSLLAEQARTKGLTLTVDTDSVPLWLRGDPTRLRQALLNYVGNAIKFTEVGSVQLQARLLSDDGQACVVRFEVSDTGVGLAPAAAPFQSFDRLTPVPRASTAAPAWGWPLRANGAPDGWRRRGGQRAWQGSTFWFGPHPTWPQQCR
jgi:K+-sensing histidine kinase KdpD